MICTKKPNYFPFMIISSYCGPNISPDPSDLSHSIVAQSYIDFLTHQTWRPPVSSYWSSVSFHLLIARRYVCPCIEVGCSIRYLEEGTGSPIDWSRASPKIEWLFHRRVSSISFTLNGNSWFHYLHCLAMKPTLSGYETNIVRLFILLPGKGNWK